MANDGIINFVQLDLSFLPKDIDRDELSQLLRLLIMKVKEEHAQFQYKKELRHYAMDIVQIMNVAKKNGYKITNAPINNENNDSDDIKPASASYVENNEDVEKKQVENSEIDYDKIIDS